MKKKMTVLAAATVLLISAAFANNSTGPSLRQQAEFNRLFAQSTDVKWEAVSSLYKVTFQQGENYLTAFFNPEGGIESVSRNITLGSLPLLLQKGVRDKLSDAWVSESFELAGKNGTAYYITLENAGTKTIYQSSDNDWMEYKKLKK